MLASEFFKLARHILAFFLLTFPWAPCSSVRSRIVLLSVSVSRASLSSLFPPLPLKAFCYTRPTSLLRSLTYTPTPAYSCLPAPAFTSFFKLFYPPIVPNTLSSRLVPSFSRIQCLRRLECIYWPLRNNSLSIQSKTLFSTHGSTCDGHVGVDRTRSRERRRLFVVE